MTAEVIQHKATGRRKTSMARVRLLPGTGAITINKRPLDEYFPNNVLKMIIKQPLISVDAAEKFDILVRVAGGGAAGGRAGPPAAGALRRGGDPGVDELRHLAIAACARAVGVVAA